MTAVRFLRYLYQAHLSSPAHQREIYREIRQHAPITRIVQIGVGDGVLAQKLIDFAQQYAGETQIEYTGIDMFEAREKKDGLALKQAHKCLVATGAKVKLTPGTASMALPRLANSLPNTQLLLIAADQETSDVNAAISWLPRMLTEKSVIFWERLGDNGLHIEKLSLSHFATSNSARRAA
ncbi:hypothetical protein LOC68_27075 [Blastopirellula sp. JC732]|uniref:Uncharacterized protein n=1 Tax=Blastopirellula sediminis TaxID=2894196 RepID=A0A9X1MR90_9BACT|nr:hypothetical protein [Blastopirellula sediminis]MCC9604628.1 hypothetical protein [Blastopirellula sediminis]MCC9632073.1 hypothetical protein [Blastopirellula sediminis]